MMISFADILLMATIITSLAIMGSFVIRMSIKKRNFKKSEYSHLIDRMYRAEMYIRLLQERVTRLEEGEADV